MIGENQGQEEKTSSAGTHHMSQEYEDGSDEQKTEKNGGVFLKETRAQERGFSATERMESITDVLISG